MSHGAEEVKGKNTVSLKGFRRSAEIASKEEPVNYLLPGLAGNWLGSSAPDLIGDEWIIPDLVLEGEVSLVQASGASFKTTWIAGVMASAAAGNDVMSMGIDQPLRCMMITTEDTANDLKKKMWACIKYFDLEIADNYRVAPIEVVDWNELPQLVENVGSDFMVDYGLEPETPISQWVKMIMELRLRVLVIDPLVNLVSAWKLKEDNESFNHIITAFKTVARRANIGIVITHHTTKAGSHARGEAEAGRGGGALQNAARLTLGIGAMDDKEASELELPASEELKQYIVVEVNRSSRGSKGKKVYSLEFENVRVRHRKTHETYLERIPVLSPVSQVNTGDLDTEMLRKLSRELEGPHLMSLTRPSKNYPDALKKVTDLFGAAMNRKKAYDLLWSLIKDGELNGGNGKLKGDRLHKKAANWVSSTPIILL